MAYLYHGTHTGGIKVLEPRSILHGTNESVVYLTGNRVYGLGQGAYNGARLYHRRDR